jgi:molybdopterin-guanine dinucleotide biosynthesis protein A/rhodanese-related sulfurtransferase
VLCGGASRRMGHDKATLLVDGRPLARRVADALVAGGAGRVVAVGGDAPALRGAGLEVIDDRWPGQGPLGGLATALRWSSSPVVVVSACDHPQLAGDDVRRLISALDHPGVDVAVASVGRRRHPTLAAWRVDRCQPVVTEVFGDGGRSLRAALDRLRVAEVQLDEGAVTDLDRPEDVAGYHLALVQSAATLTDGPAPSQETQMDSPQMDTPEIDIEALAELLESGGAQLVDVRQPDEYLEGHLPGAVLVPLAEVPDRLAEMPADGVVHVVCRSGGRSAQAVGFLRNQGIEAVNVAGGTLAWIESGRAVVVGDQPA